MVTKSLDGLDVRVGIDSPTRMPNLEIRPRQKVGNENVEVWISLLVLSGHLLHDPDTNTSSKCVADPDRNVIQDLGNRGLDLSGLRLPPETAVGGPDQLGG